MLPTIKQYVCYLFNDKPGDLRKKSIILYALLITYTALVWLWAFYALQNKPFLFSTAILAYTFGLRHAVDADHIAAIDNVTRKLMQEGKEPLSLGFFFSLGHSTVVILATIGIAIVTSAVFHSHLSEWRPIASIICTSISASFLLIIAMINLFIFLSIWKTFKEVRRNKYYSEKNIDELINNSGFLARYFRVFFKLIKNSWQMYFVGFLFGIGFDTATEIALLSIAASQATQGVSCLTILVFPALFTAGMTLIDTTDCIIMLGAYGWAYMKPIRKLYYNLTITFISWVVALFIGGLEAIALIVDQFKTQGVVSDLIRSFNANMNYLGYFIIVLFILCWGVSIAVYNYLKVEELIKPRKRS